MKSMKTNMLRCHLGVLGTAALVLGWGANGVTTVDAADWPQWGGTNARNMHSPTAENLPADIVPGEFEGNSEEIDMSTTENVKWVVKLGSQTYSTPVIAQGRIFVGTNNENSRDPRFKGDNSILMCFDEETGEFQWQFVVPKLGSGKVNDWERLGMLSSPTVEGDRLYIVTTRNEVVCLDLNGFADGNDGPYQEEGQYYVGEGNQPVAPQSTDADIIWIYDMMNNLGVFPHNSSNSSPLLVNGRVYVGTSNGVDWTHKNVPSPYAPSLICLDQETGELLGEDNALIGQDLFHGQWSSPSYGEVDGQGMIFFGGGDGYLYAFDPKPELNEDEGLSFMETLWKADAVPPEYRGIEYPQPEGPSEINATPVFYDGKVYAAIGQDPAHSEGLGNLICVDASKRGDVTEDGILWNYQKINRSISTVAIADGLLYIGDFSGFVHCLDAETGESYWVHDMKAHMWGSAFAADGKVYIGDEDGDFVVFAAGKEKKVLSQRQVRGRTVDGPNFGSPIYCTPVAANNVLYVATTTHLYAISSEAQPTTASDQVPEVEQ